MNYVYHASIDDHPTCICTILHCHHVDNSWRCHHCHSCVERISSSCQGKFALRYQKTEDLQASFRSATRCQVAIESCDGGLHYHMQHRLHSLHLVYPLLGMVRARNLCLLRRGTNSDRTKAAIISHRSTHMYIRLFLSLSLSASRISREICGGPIRASAAYAESRLGGTIRRCIRAIFPRDAGKLTRAFMHDGNSRTLRVSNARTDEDADLVARRKRAAIEREDPADDGRRTKRFRRYAAERGVPRMLAIFQWGRAIP